MTEILREGTPASTKVRVQLGAVKVHGPDSPDVKSGRFPEGYREKLDSAPTVQEVDYKTAVVMFGEETADQLFAGISEEERGG